MPRSGSAAVRRSAFPNGFDAEPAGRPKRFIECSPARAPNRGLRRVANAGQGTDMKRLLAPAVTGVIAAAIGLSAPAAAQDAAGDKVNVIQVFGTDPCPQSTETEIVVCERGVEEDRYRIPEALRGSDSPANEAWASRVRSIEAVGDLGPLSCAPVGAG